MKVLDIPTHQREELVDITTFVSDYIRDSRTRSGVCLVFIPHTTAGVTINENADPNVGSDLLAALRKTVPDSLPYRHSEGNSPAHVKASLVGSSVSLVVEDGRPQLGTWQGIFLCEFDGPRRRKVWVKTFPS